MKPAAFERFSRSGWVLQVALHHGVAAHEDLTDGLTIALSTIGAAHTDLVGMAIAAELVDPLKLR